MNEATLMSITDAAQRFGVYNNTISDLMKKNGITPKPMTNGRAKGLDKADMRKLARCLGGKAAAAAN